MEKVDAQLIEALDSVRPVVSVDLVRELLAEQGCVSPDPRCAKLASVAVERFLSKVLSDVLEVMANRPATASKGKDVGGNLSLYDLVRGLQEAGVILDKPSYFVSKPTNS